MPRPSNSRNFGLAWFFLCFAFAAHIADEALTGFLPVYNATVRAARAEISWFPMPTFEYREWLFGLIGAVAICLLLTPVAYRNSRWLRPLAWFFAGVLFLNGLAHTLATIFGRTVSSVHFPRPAPGFYSSPFLLAASLYLFARLLHTRRVEHASPLITSR